MEPQPFRDDEDPDAVRRGHVLVWRRDVRGASAVFSWNCAADGPRG